VRLKVLYERCAGCDIHKKTVTIHVVVPKGGETRTYGTTTTELLEAVEGLVACRGDPCGDGKYRSLLEAPVQPARSHWAHRLCGQRRAHEGRPGSDD
jgi:hypothetical protein